MKYTVSVGGEAFEVDLSGGRIALDGKPLDAQLHAVVGTPLRQLVLTGRSVTFAMVRQVEGWTLLRAGEIWDATVVDERTRQLREMTGQSVGSGDQVVAAPMPGLVLRVEVQVGTRVKAGAGLLVLEAMKMENELRSPIAGTVTAVHVESGQPVEKGARLVEVAAPVDPCEEGR